MRVNCRQTSSWRIGGVPEHFNLPWHLALGSVDAAEGPVPVWQDYTTGTGAMLADLAAGRLDLANLLTEGAALGLARGLPIAAVSLYTTSPLIWGVHVPPASGSASLADLRGRRFAISRPGSGSHLMSLALAIAEAWPVDAQRFVVVDDLDGAIEAFAADRADVFLWERFTTEPVVEAGLFRRIDDFVSPWPAWVVCVNSAFWQRERAHVERLLGRVTAEAGRLARAPDAVSRIAAAYGLREAAVGEWLARTEWVERPTSPDRALAAARAMLEAAGEIGS